VAVTATGEDGAARRFEAVLRLDSPVDVRYYRNGGILHTVLREFLKAERVVA
jgi:aconitate hydratase